MAVLAGKDASIAIAAGSSTAFTNEATTGNAARTIYTITNTAKRYWDPAAAITVQTSPNGSTWTTAAASTYTVGYAGGTITFATALAAGSSVRVSGSYFTSTTIGQAYEWSLDLSLDTVEVSTFASSFKQFIPALRGATASVSDYYLDSTLSDLIGTRFIISLSTGAGRYEGFAWITQDSLSAATGDAVGESLSFTFDSTLTYAA